MDIVDISLLSHQPKQHQTENWLLSPRCRWQRIGRASWTNLADMLDAPKILWNIGSHTHQGWHDRVALGESKNLACSLYFLHLDQLRLQVLTPGAEYGKSERRVQGKFRYKDVYYRMWITDPRIESIYSRRPDGEHTIANRFVTVSLSEPLLGFCYKLVASVITRPAE